MPVRLLGDGHDARPLRSTGSRSGGTRKALLATGVVILLVGAVIADLVQRASNTATTTTTTPTLNTAATPSGATVRATLMPRGTLAAGTGGTQSLHGVPVGYPHTKDGAVNAAYNYATMVQQAMWNIRTRDAVIDYVSEPTVRATSKAKVGQLVAQTMAANHLDEHGNVLLADGSIDPSRWWIAWTDGRYGAYKIVSASAEGATLQVWAPTLIGPGTIDDLSEVRVAWLQTGGTVRWIDGDWRLTGDSPDASKTGPTPAEPKNPATSLGERASLLGAGWVAPANARETALMPVTDLPPRPIR